MVFVGGGGRFLMSEVPLYLGADALLDVLRLGNRCEPRADS